MLFRSEFLLIVALIAVPKEIAFFTASRLSTGSAPGSPKQVGQTFLLGSSPKLVAQKQKIFVLVLSWTCTSKPIIVSYADIFIAFCVENIGI